MTLALSSLKASLMTDHYEVDNLSRPAQTPKRFSVARLQKKKLAKAPKCDNRGAHEILDYIGACSGITNPQPGLRGKCANLSPD
jgi:hypothetical protein